MLNSLLINLSKRYFGQLFFKTMHGVALEEIVTHLENFAPLQYAEKWDNVGLLLEPYNQGHIEKIMLTNDLTECVMQEAVENKINMIISYHPPIFAPIKRITQSDWKQRIISVCLRKGIALYSPHTAWDAINGGVNDWLASSLPYDSIKVIEPLDNSSDSNIGIGRLMAINISLQEAINCIQKHIGLDVHVAFGIRHNSLSNISRVALCAGSGTTVLRNIAADLFVTGEMSHHDILHANHNNTTVILCNHSNSERGFLKTFQPILKRTLEDKCEVIISRLDKDPLKTFIYS